MKLTNFLNLILYSLCFNDKYYQNSLTSKITSIKFLDKKILWSTEQSLKMKKLEKLNYH